MEYRCNGYEYIQDNEYNPFVQRMQYGEAIVILCKCNIVQAHHRLDFSSRYVWLHQQYAHAEILR